MLQKKDSSIVRLALLVILATTAPLAASLSPTSVLAQSPTPTQPTPSPSATPTASANAQAGLPLWLWLVPLAGLGGLGWWLSRRSTPSEEPSTDEIAPVAPPPAPIPKTTIPPAASDAVETPVSVEEVSPVVDTPELISPLIAGVSDSPTIIEEVEPAPEPTIVAPTPEEVESTPEPQIAAVPTPEEVKPAPEPTIVAASAAEEVEPAPEPTIAPSITELSIDTGVPPIAGLPLVSAAAFATDQALSQDEPLPEAELPAATAEIPKAEPPEVTATAPIETAPITPDHPIDEVSAANLTADSAPNPAAAAAIAGGAALAAEAAAWSLPIEDSAQTKVGAAKFNVGQDDLTSESLADVDAGLPELPDGYGESRIVLLSRDPQWAYAYWDIPNDHREAVRRQGGQRLALRLYDVTGIDLNEQNPHSLQQYDCDELAREWYLAIPVSDRDYVAEMGYLTEDGRWLMLARSQPVRVPPVFPSDWFEDRYLNVSWDEELQGKTLLELLPPGARTTTGNPIYDRIFGMAESAEAMRVAGSLFGSMQQVPGSIPPGSAQMIPGSGQMMAEQALSSYVFPSGIGMGVAGIPGVPTVSGLTMSGVGMVPGFPTLSGIGMSGIGMSGIGMMSGVGFSASMPPLRSRKFWLVADAELIVYGATEPDATVTINGQPIQLNPDGTFRFQMSFPDGLIEFPILAVAADGEQNRAIHMQFNRETPVRRTNTRDDAIDESY